MGPQRTLTVGPVQIGNTRPLVVIAGPCVMESGAFALEMAEHLHSVCRRLDLPLIFKTSFDKANRTRSDSPRGMSMDQALPVFAEIRKRTGLPVLTDVHLPDQCAEVAKVVDILQIPAFLCRQTDLLTAAAHTGKTLNIKKGQFLSPQDMTHIVDKAVAAGNDQVMLCERGVSFGYNTLVSDFRSLQILSASGFPVIFDATHSVQQPGGLDGRSGGDRRFVETLARAAVAVGVAGVFIETHPDPDNAPSDGPNMVPLNALEGLLRTLKILDEQAKKLPYQSFSSLSSPSL